MKNRNNTQKRKSELHINVSLGSNKLWIDFPVKLWSQALTTYIIYKLNGLIYFVVGIPFVTRGTNQFEVKEGVH